MKKKLKIIIPIVCILFATILSTSLIAIKNPRVRMFLCTLHFSEKTLKDPSYLLYDIDIMKLFHDYSNADTAITGKVGLSKMKKLNSSVYMNIDAKRSYSQKRMTSHSKVDILWLEAGDIDFYAENDTVYFVVPLLGDFGYAFPTGIDLFMKMPDFTSDINQKWFHDNMTNIITFMKDIRIDQTLQTYIDDAGKESEEFVVTIPKGCGKFIWDLLGMESPDYDVVVSLFLTSDNYMSRIQMDLSHVMEGAALIIDGESSNKMIMNYELPENEKMEMVLIRNPNHTNYIDASATYFTNVDTTYTMTSSITWNKQDDNFSVYVKNMKICCEGNQLAQGYFKGNVAHLSKPPDIFDGKDNYLYGLEKLDWRKIRDDAEPFINDILDQIKKSVLK